MKILRDAEEKEAMKYIDIAAKLAINATCDRSKCGSIIVKDGEIIGQGINSPPANILSQKRCSCSKDSYDVKITDKTCCIHAEQRAIMDALKHHSQKIFGSRIYFIRLDKHDKKIEAGNPYCTMCSKMALDTGIKEFVLWHNSGITVYDTEEYNDLSFQYKE